MRDPGLYVVVVERVGGVEVPVRRRLKRWVRYAQGEDGIPKLQHTDDLSAPFEDVQR